MRAFAAAHCTICMAACCCRASSIARSTAAAVCCSTMRPRSRRSRRIAAAHRQFGTTGLLPTLISDDRGVMRAAIGAVAAAIGQDVPGMLGIHLEGPFLAPARKGIHDASEIPCAGCCGHRTGLLPPERGKNAADAGAGRGVAGNHRANLSTRGVVLAAGHTAATYAQTSRGARRAACAVSPIYTTRCRRWAVASPASSARRWRMLQAGAASSSTATMCTRRHCAWRSPRSRKVRFSWSPMPCRPWARHGPIFILNGETITCHDGFCTNAQGVLAGSALDMASAVRNAVSMLRIPLVEALRMASAYPAAFLGLDHTTAASPPATSPIW